MPRRYYNYLDQFQPLHAFSTVGSWILGVGFFITAVYLLASLRQADATRRRTRGARLALEWQTASPPPSTTSSTIPVVTHGPYDYSTPERVTEPEEDER